MPVCKRTSALLRVQNYTLYWVIQAFSKFFFDVFVTLSLTCWYHVFWRKKFFPLPDPLHKKGWFYQQKLSISYLQVSLSKLSIFIKSLKAHDLLSILQLFSTLCLLKATLIIFIWIKTKNKARTQSLKNKRSKPGKRFYPISYVEINSTFFSLIYIRYQNISY